MELTEQQPTQIPEQEPVPGEEAPDQAPAVPETPAPSEPKPLVPEDPELSAPESPQTTTVILEDQEEPEWTPPPRKPIRPELIMGLIALLAGVLLVVMVVLCLPHFPKDEDPESIKHPSALETTQPVEETILEPTESATEPENPTIPPDPNPYDRNDFQYNRNNYLLLQNLISYPGVDVSAHQRQINWEAVAASGIDFAMIRLGYRGYETGRIVEDEYARQNLNGAAEAGLRVGAYFFSQALSIQEVDQEIEFMLEVLGEFHLTMPIVLDWEIPASTARTANMDARTLTDLQLHFCQVMEQKGYQPMIYFNWHQSENLYYLSELEDAPFWLALYQDRMTYPWKVEMWQYTDQGTVPGISGNVDLNVYMPD